MQIFPAFASLNKSSGNPGFEFDAGLFEAPEIDFANVFNTFMNSAADEAPYQPVLPERAAPPPRSPHPERSPAQDAPAASVHRKDLPANREDFARLREKLEELGVEEDVLDQVEDLFDQPGTVTWGQVYDVLRKPLEQKADIRLTAEQKQDILNLFNKMGFTPQDAKVLLTDLLDNKHDAVWKKVQQMVSTLGNGENLSVTIKEITSLLKALGLDLSEIAKNGLKNLTADAQAGLQKAIANAAQPAQQKIDRASHPGQPVSAETQAALKTVLAAAKGEARPDGEALVAMQKVMDAALKGEIKLDPATLAALKQGLDAVGLDAAKFGQILQQAGSRELTPEQLRKVLAMIQDAAAGNTQAEKTNKGQILSEIHQAMAAAEGKDQRMAQADRMDTGTTPKLGQSEVLDAMKGNTGSNSGSENTDQNAGRNAQHNSANKSSQGWENFWQKINVKNAGDGAAAAKDIAPDARADVRPVFGQTQTANATEAAAGRILNNAPAPHRAVLQQVHSGLLQNLGQGRQQLTLQLNPPDLGSLTVNLKMVGKELQAVLRAENQEARQIIAENMPALRQSLEAQGLRVTRLEVQTQLQDQNQNQFTQLWQGMDGQKFQEQGSRTQWNALGRGQSKGGPSGADVELDEHAALNLSLREGGINLIA